MGRKVWVILVAAIAIVCVSAVMLLQNSNDDDNNEPVLAELNYMFHEDDETAEVCGIMNRDYATALVIPEKALRDGIEYRIVSIAYDVFRDCTNLTGDLVIPGNVESIGDSAFYGCGFDGKLTLGNGLRTIGDKAFSQCGFKGNLTIPDSLEAIGNGAFQDCAGLTGKLTLGNGLRTIGDDAFYGCRLTGDLTITNHVRSIGSCAFSGCEFSGTLRLGNDLETIRGPILQRFEGDLIFDCNLRSTQEMIFAGCDFKSITVLKNGFVLGDMRVRIVEEINVASNVTNTGALTSGWHFFDGTKELSSDDLPGYTYKLDGDRMVRHGEFHSTEAMD